MKPIYYKILGIIAIVFLIYFVINKINFNFNYKIGQEVDSLNGVKVYFNGAVGNVQERNLSKDGYNLGLKYQCVEFVKRYYYEHFSHKMPDSYGHAKDFFDKKLQDSNINKARNLIQFTNPSISKPQINDIVVFDMNVSNIYGHIAIISNVSDNEIEIIQQNPGPFASSRERYKLTFENQKWEIEHKTLLGRLRYDSTLSQNTINHQRTLN